MLKPPVLSVVIGATALLLATSCSLGTGSNASAPTSSATQPVRIGTRLPMTGPDAAASGRDRKALAMAISDLNAAGGILGRQVVLETVDAGCDGPQAVTAARELIRRKIDISVGVECSTSLMQAIPVLRKAGISHIEASANSTDLLKNRYDGLFLLTGTVVDEASVAAVWLPRLGAHRTAIVYDATTYPLTFALSLQQSMSAAKRPPALFLEIIQGARAYASTVDKILASDADSVLYTGYHAEAGVLVKDLRAAGFTKPIILGDSGASLAMIDISGAQALRNVYFVTPPLPETTPSATTWLTKYRAFTQSEPEPFSMQAYMSVIIAASAIERAGNTDHTTVRNAIAATAVDGPYGRVTFDARGVDTSTGYQLLSIKDKAFQPVCPPTCR